MREQDVNEVKLRATESNRPISTQQQKERKARLCDESKPSATSEVKADAVSDEKLTEAKNSDRLSIPTIKSPSELSNSNSITKHARDASFNLAPLVEESDSLSGSCDDELALIERRCRVKAAGARWAMERRRLQDVDADYEKDISPTDHALIDRAKSIPGGCNMWMNQRISPDPENPMDWATLANCFEALADAIKFVSSLQKSKEMDVTRFKQALNWIAEAQSALRVVALSIRGSRDSDQQQIYNWLRSVAEQSGIWPERYMRLDDPADPARSKELRAEIEKAQERIRSEECRRKYFEMLRGACDQIDQRHSPNRDWSLVFRLIETLIDGGLPPSNPDLRELLLPILDQMPSEVEMTDSVKMALRETNKFLDQQADCFTPELDETKEWSAEVQRVADMLAGKRIVVIGGERRQHNVDRIKDAFGLAEVLWIEGDRNQSYTACEKSIALPDVAVVLLLIGWAKHEYGNVDVYCRKYETPLVRVQAGYNPNQLAVDILNQVSDRLG